MPAAAPAATTPSAAPTRPARRPYVRALLTATPDVGPRQSRAEARDDLVGDRVQRGRPVLRCWLAVVTRTEEHDLVTDADLVVADVEHELVHADGAGDASAFAGDQYLGIVARGTRDAVGVPHRH